MNQSDCRVSVIIPCFNHGHYLDEAIDSVLAQTFQNFEIIVVNDGSTDPATIELLKGYDRPKTKVIHTSNQGLPSARNNGIQAAIGEYILPLDADDKIGSSYLEKAVGVLDSNPEIGIVYCEAEYFGDSIGKWELEEYRFPEILLGNVIFCSGFYRRADWERVGGYRSNMVYGWEDYDFWLSLIELGRQVYRIPEVLFSYRQTADSMTERMGVEHHVSSQAQIYRNHSQLYFENIEFLGKHILKQSQALNRNHIELHQTQAELGKAYEALEGMQEVLRQTQAELERSRLVIEARQTSKFWKARDLWFRLKQRLGLPTENAL